MLSKQEKTNYRATLFRHLDGIATVTTAYSLYKKGVLEFLLQNKSSSINELTVKFKANKGYLNIALRVLCSQGWLTQNITNDDVIYSINKKSYDVIKLIPLFKKPVNHLKYSSKYSEEGIHEEAIIEISEIFKIHQKKYDLKKSSQIETQIITLLEGIIIAPIIVLLGMNGMFHKYFMETSFRAQEFHKDPENFKKILDFFVFLNWFEKKTDTYQFTDKGLFFAKRASSYGVTVSYLPTFYNLDKLIFGNPLSLKSDVKEPEKHVNREMNVWGSGGAHNTYFKVIDKIIIKLFNKPLHEQPKGILDMGCGNGAFIQHIFEVIENQTLRGKHLEDYPLLLVGVDFNKAALKVSRANLIKADIWAKLIWGDIGKPNILANDLKNNYNIELKDLLNVRTFLDHNRVWKTPLNTTDRESTSTGAFATKGEYLTNSLVEDSLLEHLAKWKPYIQKFGLLVIELHTLPPALVAKNLGKTAATAYDATHGFSDQYILEIEVFNKIAKEAGLKRNTSYEAKFPNNELATVSINLFEGEED